MVSLTSPDLPSQAICKPPSPDLPKSRDLSTGHHLTWLLGKCSSPTKPNQTTIPKALTDAQSIEQELLCIVYLVWHRGAPTYVSYTDGSCSGIIAMAKRVCTVNLASFTPTLRETWDSEAKHPYTIGYKSSRPINKLTTDWYIYSNCRGSQFKAI